MPTPDNSRLKHDERGRPYYDVPGQPGRRSYVSPVALGTGTKPADKTGVFRGAPQWNARKGDWETPLDLGNIGNMAALSLLTAGGAHAAGAFGGAGGAAASPSAGVGGLGPAGAPGGAFYGASAPAGFGAGTGIGAGGAAAGSAVAAAGGRNWITDALFAGLPHVANLVGTKVASNASDRAAQIQADAFRDALRQQREMYDQDRADFAPYRDAGSRSVTRMSDLLAGQNQTPMPASVQARLSGPGDTYTPVPIGPGIDPRTRQPRPPMYGTAGSMSDLGRPSGGQPTGPGPQSPPSVINLRPRPDSTWDTQPVSTTMPVDGSGGTVRLLAPTGEIREVPVHQAEAWVRLGAKRVG